MFRWLSWRRSPLPYLLLAGLLAYLWMSGSVRLVGDEYDLASSPETRGRGPAGATYVDRDDRGTVRAVRIGNLVFSAP